MQDTMTGEEMRKFRKSLKLSQPAFGKLVGRSAIHISNYERGVYRIPTVVIRACEGLIANEKGTGYGI